MKHLNEILSWMFLIWSSTKFKCILYIDNKSKIAPTTRNNLTWECMRSKFYIRFLKKKTIAKNSTPSEQFQNMTILERQNRYSSNTWLFTLSNTHDCSLSLTHDCSLSLTHDCSLSLTHITVHSNTRLFTLSNTHDCSLSNTHDCSLSLTHMTSLSPIVVGTWIKSGLLYGLDPPPSVKWSYVYHMWVIWR